MWDWCSSFLVGFDPGPAGPSRLRRYSRFYRRRSAARLSLAPRSREVSVYQVYTVRRLADPSAIVAPDNVNPSAQESQARCADQLYGSGDCIWNLGKKSRSPICRAAHEYIEDLIRRRGPRTRFGPGDFDDASRRVNNHLRLKRRADADRTNKRRNEVLACETGPGEGDSRNAVYPGHIDMAGRVV